jgi:opacity protein-like surface antigen
MKKHILLAVLVAAFPFAARAGTDEKDMKDMKSTSAVEQSDAGFYVAAYGGSEFATHYGDKRQTFDPNGPGPVLPLPPFAATTTAGSSSSNQAISSGYGGAGGIKFGYNFQSFPICDTMHLRLQPAVEAEALYLGTSSQSRFTGPTATTFVFGFPFASAPTTGTIKDSFNSAAWFVNGILRFKNSSIVTPYIGAGVGGQYITIHGQATYTTFPVNPTISGLNGSDLDFAGQALGGLDVAITPQISLFGEYKFIDAIGTDAKTSNVGSTNETYRFKPDQIMQNVVVLGLKYSF